MHVLSSQDILVAQVVFCQNILFADWIKKEKALKMFLWFLVAGTMFSVTSIRLSQADKSTVSETVHPRFTMKITSLYIALLKYHSVCSVLTKIHKIWSLHQFKKQNSAKIQVLGIKRYISTILHFMSISDTQGFKLKPNISTMLLGQLYRFKF